MQGIIVPLKAAVAKARETPEAIALILSSRVDLQLPAIRKVHLIDRLKVPVAFASQLIEHDAKLAFDRRVSRKR